MSGIEAAEQKSDRVCSPPEQPYPHVRHVARYLTTRGLAANSRDAAELLQVLLELPARISTRRVSVTCAARLMYTSRRTLSRRCERAGLPTPSHLLAFGRILNTMRVLRTSGWSIARASRATGWPDPFTFSNTMYRMTGTRPTDARKRGLLLLAEAWLRRELAQGRAKLTESSPASCPSCGSEVAP